MAAMGPDFGSSAWPSLQQVVADAAAVVPQAGKEDHTILEGWLTRSSDPTAHGRPKFGELGGGSDHVGFLCFAGVASASLGAGGSPGTSYHSTYDNLAWYHKVVGDDYLPARMIAQMEALIAARLAHAPILPLDFPRFGADVPRALKDLTKRARDLEVLPKDGPDIAPAFSSLADIAIRFEADATKARDRLEHMAEAGDVEPATAARINNLLLSMDRAWLSDRGIPDRPWYRNLYAATDEDSGYGAWVLPVLRHAVEHKDLEELGVAVQMYDGIFSDLIGKVRELDALLD
jgi:N-acetylated-alpha-linked acidic dipeptidase